MYEEEKHGITFSVDPRVEIIFAIMSKARKEYYDLLLQVAPSYADDDFIEYFADDYSKYASKMYDIIDFEKYPNLLKWAMVILSQGEDLIPTLALKLDENFDEKENFKYYDMYEKFFTKSNYKEFYQTLKDFVENENYLEFYRSNFGEYHKMIEESSSYYPDNMDIRDIEKFYNSEPINYSVIYSIFFNGGFGIPDDESLVCFKGLWIDKDDKYYESIKETINLYHEYSHPIINPLVDKYWDSFENTDEFLEYSIENGLHPAYQGKEETLYYEYFVRAMSYIMASKYEDEKEELEDYKKMGFVKLEEIINFINDNFKIGDHFEEFFATKLIPYTNIIVSEINKQHEHKTK